MPTWWSAVPKGSPHPQQCGCRLQGRRWWDLASESKTIQGQDRRKRIAFGGLWKGRLKSISSRFRETPPAGRPTNCESSGAGRSWKREAASMGARCVLQGNEKTRRKRYAACDELVRPTGFEPATFRVGVLRPSKAPPLGRMGFSGFARILRHLQKTPGAIVLQWLRVFCK